LERFAAAGRDQPFWYGPEASPALLGFGSSGEPAPPRSRQQAVANPYGVFDPLGNVWEWCSDRVDERGKPRAEATGLGWRVIRGGSGFARPDDCTCRRRKIWPAGGSLPTLGFRIVLET